MKIDRLVSIIMILLEKERVEAKELADMFEVSLRTIYRDIDTINMAGIPVHGAPGVGGGFEIMPNYKVDKNIFSTADLSTILMGLSNFSTVVRGEELVNALAKVKSFIPADRARDIELRANQIYVDLSPWTGNRNLQPYLEISKTALQESRLLSFDYTDKHSRKTARVIEPYQLVLKGSHWYLQGYCFKRKDFRLFKLTRMSNLQMKKESFVPREYERPQLGFEDALDSMKTMVKIRIHKSILDRVLDYCPLEDFMPDGDEHYLLEFPFTEDDSHYDTLLSLGNKCECLKPPHVRKELKRRINQLALLYGEKEETRGIQ